VAAAESTAASALRRAALVGEEPAVARISDLPGVVPTLRGKVEFEVSEEGRELDILEHLLRRATAEVFRDRLAGLDLEPFVTRFDDGDHIDTGELVAAADVLAALGPVSGLGKTMERLGLSGAESPTFAASAVEFALEGLYLTRRISKVTMGGRDRYSAT
jgi:magnesium chelatase subunit I